MGNPSDMAIFTKVVQAGGFSAAARQLRLSKAAVSKRLARLEDRLGARLLNRTTRRLALTEEGAAFYERATRILAEIDDAERAVSRLGGEPRGTLRISAPMSFGVLHLAGALPAFLAEHPALAIDIALNDRLVDVVEEGFDVAIRIARLPDSSLVARRLASTRSLTVAHPGYWREHGKPRHPSELRHHNCLRYSYQLSLDDWTFKDGLSVTVDGTFVANNGDVLRSAALAGLGVTRLPSFIAGDDVQSGRLEAALEGFEETEASIYAIYPHRRHLSAKVRAFVDFLAQRFGPLPPWEAAVR